MRQGVRIGVDVGDVRIGVARCDPAGLIATPVETVARGKGDLARLTTLAAEHEAVEVVVGLPRSLSGGEGPSAGKVRAFAVRLAGALAPVPVRLYDERLSTVSAEATLRAQGRKGQRRRAVVDQAAAVVILQSALDAERGTAATPGEVVEPRSRERVAGSGMMDGSPGSSGGAAQDDQPVEPTQPVPPTERGERPGE